VTPPHRVVLRQVAQRDVEEAVAYYVSQGAIAAAVEFVARLEEALTRISRHPSAGSPRYSHALDLPGLRSWILDGYPYLVFYVERPDHIDVWRVLHGERDIPAWMRAEE
jgi:toxin ParE1/3/4